MSLEEHAEDGRRRLMEQGIRNWFEFGAAILFKFGEKFAVYVALVAVLGGVAWLLMGHYVVQNERLSEAQREYIDYMKETSTEKAELVRSVVGAQSEVAKANTALADAVTDLKDELRRPR